MAKREKTRSLAASNSLLLLIIPVHIKKYLLLIVSIFLVMDLSAQESKSDTSKKVDINIVHAEYGEYVETDTNAFNKLVGNVELEQEGNLMYCDSAYLNIETNNVEAFGDVYIKQPDGTEAASDYLKYTGNTRMAYMKGNVSLTDGKDNLWSEEVTYNMKTKVGTYAQGGTLQSGQTTLSSNSGEYNLRTKDARFIEDVMVYDPEYEVVSDEMGYNTESKIVSFFAPSVVTSDKSVLRTTCGTYNTILELANFPCRSSTQSEEQYLEADYIDYDKKKGIGLAQGDVIAIDTTQNITLYCGRADVNEKRKTTLATIKPVLKQNSGDDSLFIRADTFFSAPIPLATDTVTTIIKKGRGKKKKEEVIKTLDSTSIDKSRKRYLTGYHNVLIYSDSLQGKCDSMSYSDEDSAMRLMYEPVLWSRKSQITGDTILLYMDSSELSKMYIPSKAFVISQSGPDKAKLYDQVQGKTLTGYFEKNALKEILVKPNVETIYYSVDESGAYIGVNEATSARMRMRMRMKEQSISSIVFEQEVKQKMTPLQDVDLTKMKLKGFIWLPELRPRSLAELFE
ncbi:MAG: OstA-like protein [Flavipsychrobacter sp.]